MHNAGALLPPPRRLCFHLGLSVRLFVYLFVCEQDNSKTYGWILIKFSGYVRKGKRKKSLHFESDLDHSLDLLDP